MARVIALAHAIDRNAQFELLRTSVVIGCALALIAAGQAMPRLF
jgi:hypothetical protein